ncbi:MAG: hypothetical protein M1827_002254 [Pycnora praestabilis]|nr:MAG: hypothetical protein M1827_002254 [Pycnora praestabilis]
MPNDEAEMDREDMKHHVFTLIMNDRLHLAPLGSNLQKILDIGTGTGIWVMQMADEYPSAEVIGTDLSPIQPKWVPPNVQFEIDDAEAEWLHAPDSVDYCHIRHLFAAIRNWPKIAKQAFRTVRPGGWAEFMELDFRPSSYDDSLPQNSQQLGMYKLLSVASSKAGLDADIAVKLKGYVIDVGFEEVTEEVLDVPMGGWARDPRLKEAGLFHRQQFRDGLQAICMGIFTRALGWTAGEVEVFLAGIRKELDNKSIHALWKMHVVYGKKPLMST